MYIHTGILLIALIKLSEGFPVSGLSLQLPPGHTYKYKYVTDVRFNEPDVPTSSQAKQDVGFKLSCDVALVPLYTTGNKLLVKLLISNPQLDSVSRDKSTKLSALTSYPALASWEGSLVKQVYAAGADPAWSVNMKKGILSLLQIQRRAGTKTEVDASGECEVTYAVDGLKITETKSGCKPTSNAGQFQNVREILGVAISSSVQTKYVLSSDDVIQSVKAEEQHIGRLNMRESLSVKAHSTQSLVLDKKELGTTAVQASSIEEAAQIINAREKLQLQGSTLALSQENQQCDIENCDKLAMLIDKLRPYLGSDSVATNEGGGAFLDLVAAIRFSSQPSISSILRDANNADIVTQLIDATVAAQTNAAQSALIGFLDFNEEYDFRLQERYLLAVAFSTHPQESLLNDILNLYKSDIKNSVLHESIGDALGAIMYTYSQREGQDELIEKAKKVILERVKACSENSCKTRHIRVLGNAGIPDTVPILVQYAESGGNADLTSSSIKALRRMPKETITEEVKNAMRNIYHQYKKGYDSAVRTQALMILLDNSPTDSDIKDIMTSTTDPDQTEHSMYTQQRLFLLASKDSELKEKVQKALQDRTLRNYHILAPKGKALAFKESLAETHGLTSTYDMYVQNSKAGIMKRSGMDVDLITPSSSMPLYAFGIFAAGIEGLLGEEVDPGQGDVEPTAGLALDLLDVALRPVTFFTGQSGLMSAVWNAPSELTNALQTNFLMQDHFQTISFQNGLIANLNVQGAVSMDLSGLVSISLWNKNCHSLIKNSGALTIRGSFSLQPGAFRAGVHYSAKSTSVIDFVTDVDFYDKIKMCLQMGRQDVTFSHTVTKYERANGIRTRYRANIRRLTKSPGVSYPLPKPNNEQCRVLLAGQ